MQIAARNCGVFFNALRFIVSTAGLRTIRGKFQRIEYRTPLNSDVPFSEFVEYPEITVAQKDVLKAIGLALFGVQTLEANLRFVLSFVFPKEADATLQELYSRSAAHSKATLGRLIRKLRETADVSDEFEAQLQTFLGDAQSVCSRIARGT